MSNRILLLLLLVMSLVQCARDKQVAEHTTLSYRQTQCSDNWGYGSDDTQTLLRIRNYLDSVKLYVADLSIRTDSPADLCQACPCKTNKTIYVTTLKNEAVVEEYKDLGFK